MTYKKKLNKIIASTVVALSIFTLPAKSFALAELYPNETVYQFYESTPLGSGIEHESIMFATLYGKYNVNVIRIDIQNEYPELKGIFNPEGLNYRDSVSNMVNKNGAVAGVNGDYFDYKPVPSSLGTLINNGEMISSPIMKKYGLPTFYLNTSNQAAIDYFDRSIYLKNISKGNTIYFDTLNKVSTNFPTLAVLDKNFGHQSIGARFHKDMVEVVVDNNKVKEIRRGWDPTPIPANGFIILGRGEPAKSLDSLSVGDEVELIKETSPNLKDIKFAIGGGSTIVREAKYVNSNIADSGKNPRTGIAVNRDNSEIILVTVDGRSGVSTGMTQKEFSTLMVKLGAYHGLNLDGGGSTTMAVKKPGETTAKLANKPSGGSQRKVVNGIGVFNNAPAGSLDRIELSLNKQALILDSSNKIQLLAYDGQNNRMDKGITNYKLIVEGIDYELDGDRLIPRSEGFANITAIYNDGSRDFSSSLRLPVYSKAVDLNTDIEEIQLTPATSYPLPIFKARDISGRESVISLEDIDFEIIGDIGEIVGPNFISTGGSGYISARFGDGLATIKITDPTSPNMEEAPMSTSFRDILNADALDPGMTVLVLSETKDLSPERKLSLGSKINNSNVTISLNGFSPELNEATNLKQTKKINSGAGYSINNYNNLAVINLDSKKGSISSTNSYQWIRLKNDLKNSQAKNIIISSQSAPASYKDKLEEKNLSKILSDFKVENPDKNIFFVHGGGSGGSRLIDGVRYIGLNSSSTKEESVIANDSLLEFVMDGENLRYKYKPIYK